MARILIANFLATATMAFFLDPEFFHTLLN